MAVPFRRTSKTAKRLRRTHFKLSVSGLNTCPHCGTMIRSHHICPKCGYYDGKPVVAVPEPEKEAKKAKKAPAKAVEKAEPAPTKEVKPAKTTSAKKVTTNRKGNRGE